MSANPRKKRLRILSTAAAAAAADDDDDDDYDDDDNLERIPLMGFGTYEVKSPQVIYNALSVGYRHLDLGLNDPLVTLLMTGLEAWKPHPTFGNLQDWELNEVFCFPPENELSVEEAACEMYEYYKFWVDCTLHGKSFEVYDTI